jgi:hypothetical protein
LEKNKLKNGVAKLVLWGCGSTHVTDICSVTELNDEASLSCFSERRLFKNNFSMLLIDLDS